MPPTVCGVCAGACRVDGQLRLLVDAIAYRGACAYRPSDHRHASERDKVARSNSEKRRQRHAQHQRAEVAEHHVMRTRRASAGYLYLAR